MKSRTYLSLCLSAVLVFLSCNNAPAEHASNKVSHSIAQLAQRMPLYDNVPQLQAQFSKGDHIPGEMVCMVNNAFMGKKQILISYEGRTYFGCCGGCVERTKTDESVRVAIDPQTGKKIDKAAAYIVLIGDDGAVAYFASESNYRAFRAANNVSSL